MKLRILILLAAVLAAAPAAGQTVKSLGYNTTNGQVVYSGTNTLTFTNTPHFTNTIQLGVFGSGSARGFAGRTSGGNLALYGTNVTSAQPSFYGFDGFNNTAFSAGVARTNLGLSTTDAVTFQSLVADQLQVLIGTNLYVNLADDVSEFFVPLQLEDELAVVGAATFSTNVTVNGNLSVGSFTTTTPSTWALDATQTAAATNGILALPDNANVIRLTNNNAISGVSGGVLGAFYYLVNQTTNAVTISNVGGITVQGGTPLTLGANQAATLVATGATNASVAARGDLNDVALGGTANTAPSQTADSGAHLMTRGLSDDRYSFSRWYDANDLLSGAQLVGANPLITGNGSGHVVGAILVTVSNVNAKFMLPVDYRVSGEVKVVSYWTDRGQTNSGTTGDIAVWTFPFVVQPTTDTTTSGDVSGTQIQNTFTANYGGSGDSRFYVMEQTLNFATVTGISATNPMQLKWVQFQRRGGDASDTSGDNIYLSGVHVYVP